MLPDEDTELLDTGRRIGDVQDRYFTVPILQDDLGNLFFATVDFPTVPFSPGDRYHTVRAGEAGRLYLIAWKVYKQPDLWWAIAWANDVVFPPQDVVPGLVLRIPPLEWVLQYQANSRNG
jgi:hypothetical protein